MVPKRLMQKTIHRLATAVFAILEVLGLPPVPVGVRSRDKDKKNRA
jgi:hypothetical protein